MNTLLGGLAALAIALLIIGIISTGFFNAVGGCDHDRTFKGHKCGIREGQAA